MLPTLRTLRPVSLGNFRALRVCVMFVAMVVLLLPTGCVRRRLNVRSNPPGALVFVDNQQIGTTPCSVDFIYYGTREIRLVKPGFETLTVNQPIPMPWYQIPPIDFVSENLVPMRIMDHRTVSFDMQPQIVVPTEQLLDRANQLRQETQQVAASAPAVVAPAGAPIGAPTIAPGAAVPEPGVQGSVPPGVGGPPMESLIQPGQVSPPGGFAPTTQPSFGPTPTPLPPTGSVPPSTYNPALPSATPTTPAPFGAPSLPPDASIPPATTPYGAPQTFPQQTFPPTTLPPTATPGSQQQGPPIVSPPLR